MSIRIACECYSDTTFVREALAGLPDFDGRLEWGLPFTPDTFKLAEAEMVLIVSDRPGLLAAIGRTIIYRNLGRPHLLLYVQEQDDADLPTEAIPGVVMARSQAADGLLTLAQTLFEPTDKPGLIGVDWGDTTHLLIEDHGVVMESSSADRPEAAIDAAISQLKARTSGRTIHGIQAGIFSSGNRLPMRAVHDLMAACENCLEKPAHDDSFSIVAAPIMNWSDDNYCEVRLFARVDCRLVKHPWWLNWSSSPHRCLDRPRWL